MNILEDRLLKIDEAAAYLGVAVGTLYHWVSQERIPVVRISGRAVRFRLSALNNWATSMTIHPRSDAGR
jgi:excisionase family DNA binding protein